MIGLTLNDINPNFMKEIFYLTYRKSNVYVHFQNTIKFKQKPKVTWVTHMCDMELIT